MTIAQQTMYNQIQAQLKRQNAELNKSNEETMHKLDREHNERIEKAAEHGDYSYAVPVMTERGNKEFMTTVSDEVRRRNPHAAKDDAEELEELHEEHLNRQRDIDSQINRLEEAKREETASYVDQVERETENLNQTAQDWTNMVAGIAQRAMLQQYQNAGRFILKR